MRILSLHEDWPHPSSPAAWIHAAEYLREISKICQVSVIVSPCKPLGLNDKTQHTKKFTRRIREHGFLVHRQRYLTIKRSKSRLDDYSKALSVLYTILKEGITFQLLHAHYVYPTGYIAALVARWLRKPLIITAHGTDVWNLIHRKYLHPFVKARSMTALATANKIIAVSKDLKSMLDQLGYEQKTVVIPMGISTDCFTIQDKDICKKKLGLPLGQLYLLYASYLAEEKGSDLLPTILRCVLNTKQDVNLIIVGEGVLRVSIEREFHRLGLDTKVHFTGEISHSKVADYMGAAELLIMPSRQEGRGLVAIEALACGRPVVAFRVGGLPETIVDDTLGLLVEPENTEAFADAVNQALSRKWDAELLNRNAEQFNWKNIIPNTLNIYKRVLRLTPGTNKSCAV